MISSKCTVTGLAGFPALTCMTRGGLAVILTPLPRKLIQFSWQRFVFPLVRANTKNKGRVPPGSETGTKTSE